MTLSCCCVALFLVLQVPLVITKFESNRFLPTKICAVRGSLENHPYAQADHSVTGVISCTFRCHKAIKEGDTCIGAGLDKGRTCYTLRPFNEVTAQEKCSEDEKIQVLVVEKSCENGGVWQRLRGRCQCSGGWVGDRCHRYAHNCNELRIYGYPIDKTLWITAEVPNYGLIPNLGCKLWKEYNQTYTYIFRNEGLKSFNRTYKDYVEGFFESQQFFWLGLKHMHALTHKAELIALLNMYFFKKDEGKQYVFSRYYTRFVMSGASSGYAFDYERSHETRNDPLYYDRRLGDCLEPVRGMPFSTADHDQDASPDNCAARAGAGWWFRDCSFLCNPLGLKPSTDRFTLANPESIVKMAGVELTEAAIIQDFWHTSLHLTNVL